MYKSLLTVLIISTIIICTSCSKVITVDNELKQDNTPAAESTQVNVVEKQQIKEGEELISREQAGLCTIPVIDISNKIINNHIEAILKGEKYLNSDYISGIVQEGEGLILNERYNEDIIGNVRIRSDINEVIKLLGPPSTKEKDLMFYKTNKLCMAFKGTDKLEAVILSTIPREYDKDILNKLFLEFNKEYNAGVFSVLEENKDISTFFDWTGHIHGGGWCATSDNGNVYTGGIQIRNIVSADPFEIMSNPTPDGVFTFKGINILSSRDMIVPTDWSKIKIIDSMGTELPIDNVITTISTKELQVGSESITEGQYTLIIEPNVVSDTQGNLYDKEKG